MLRSDLAAVGNDLRDAFSWTLAQTSLVQTKTINMVLTAKPMTVITKLIPEEIITSKKKYKTSYFSFLKTHYQSRTTFETPPWRIASSPPPPPKKKSVEGIIQRTPNPSYTHTTKTYQTPITEIGTFPSPPFLHIPIQSPDLHLQIYKEEKKNSKVPVLKASNQQPSD